MIQLLETQFHLTLPPSPSEAEDASSAVVEIDVAHYNMRLWYIPSKLRLFKERDLLPGSVLSLNHWNLITRVGRKTDAHHCASSTEHTTLEWKSIFKQPNLGDQGRRETEAAADGNEKKADSETS